MHKSRYTESQIIRILKEVEGGRAVKEVCREYGVADATYYNWRSNYGGMEASDIRKIKELEDENRRLKRLYANLSLERDALKDVIANDLPQSYATSEVSIFCSCSHNSVNSCG